MNSKLALNINTEVLAGFLCCSQWLLSQSNSPRALRQFPFQFRCPGQAHEHCPRLLRPDAVWRAHQGHDERDQDPGQPPHLQTHPCRLRWEEVSNIIIFNQHWECKGTQTGLCLSRTNHHHLARTDLLTFRFIQMQSGFQEISHKTCPLESHCYRYLLVKPFHRHHIQGRILKSH